MKKNLGQVLFQPTTERKVSVLIFLIVSYIFLSLSLYKVFEKAGEDSWKALVPGYNFVVWCKIIGQPTWWALLLLIPLVNIFIYAGMAVDMVRSFGKYRLRDSALAVIYAPIAFFLLGKEEDKYVGPTVIQEKEYATKLADAVENNKDRELRQLRANNPYKKSPTREWVEAIVFAVFAAAFIRMFLIEAYVIPTPSMEGSLLVGDFLFVSKAHYGIRTPMTVFQFPLIHNQVPLLGTESYLKSPKLGYHRLPKITNVKHNDPVVFNYPEGDSVYVTQQRTYSVYDLRRGFAPKNLPKITSLKTRPIDKKDHYIKRCIGLPGDKLEIKNTQVYLNDQEIENPENMQLAYAVRYSDNSFKNQLDELGVNQNEINASSKIPNAGGYSLNTKQVQKLKDSYPGITFEMEERGPEPRRLFPHDPVNFPNWSVNNYGPIAIPKAGESIVITPKNLALYKRIISVYENNELEIKNGRIFINGEQTTKYTFKQNYYWMMGDNRHNSEDSRVWGFVPEDHVVGKPLFIWFSTKNGSIGNGINWSRIFTSANKF